MFKESDTDSFPIFLGKGLWVVGNYYFNLYVVQGEQASALIEVGVSAVVDQVIGQLQSLKIRPSFLVVTHPHADHLTGLDGLKEEYSEALVVAAEGASEFLAHPATAKAVVAEDRHMREFIASRGIAVVRPPVKDPPSLDNCLIARDGDQMDLGGRTLRFIDATGHSPGTVVVHVPEINALMLSDTLGFRFPGRGVMPVFFTGYREYLATIDRLQGLQPAVVGPAHQGPITGPEVEAAFNESRRAAEDLWQRIRKDSRDEEEIAADLFREF
ncbi:MAG: MBL fold metallo-hydrolase, partial [Deltaproteobacteria bacterium]|nr:MBL fold metallo-hydrolase [Deltaproteobacteria bacterium]